MPSPILYMRNDYPGGPRLKDLNKSDKDILWDAVFDGDLDTFNKLIDSGCFKDINEYYEGLTLLHRVVQGDDTERGKDKQHAKIAEVLLNRGAQFLPAKEDSKGKLPWGVKLGQTPWDMTLTYQNMPFYYHSGIRASFIYTGEHILPVFQKHLKIKPKKCASCTIL